MSTTAALPSSRRRPGPIGPVAQVERWIPASAGMTGLAPFSEICLPERSRSFSATIPVSPSSGAGLGKKQLGTDFGKADASNASRRDRQFRLPTMGSHSGKMATAETPVPSLLR